MTPTPDTTRPAAGAAAIHKECATVEPHERCAQCRPSAGAAPVVPTEAMVTAALDAAYVQHTPEARKDMRAALVAAISRAALASIEKVSAAPGGEAIQNLTDEEIDNVTAAHFGSAYRLQPNLMAMHRRYARAILAHVIVHRLPALPERCRKCGGTMKPGKAMGQTVYQADEGTCSPAGPGFLMDCMKCSACGWSVSSSEGGEGDALLPADEVSKRVQQVRELLDVQRREADSDAYMSGLFNGLELAMCTLENREPGFHERAALSPSGARTPDATTEAQEEIQALIEDAEALMAWCVKNVNKWSLPEYDHLSRSVRRVRAAIDSQRAEKESPR